MWRCLLVAAIVRCSVTQGVALGPWWSTAVYYRILVDSFKDGDGDGLGDLKGATKQLSYVRALGADAVILSPMGQRSLDCSQPGSLQLTELDQRYGSLEDFSMLLDKANKLELKVVVSMPLQTVSAASEWFTFSAEKAPQFEDMILWREGTTEDPPPPENGTDWSWSWHEGRAAFWAKSNGEVVLDMCSERLVAAFSAAACAWLRRGAAGMLLNPDFPPAPHCGAQLVRKMAADAVGCARAGGFDVPVILAETSLKPEESSKYYSDGGSGAHSVLSRALSMPARGSSADLAVAFHAALLTAAQDLAPTWITSATGESRTATRFGSDMVDAVNLLALTLPGAAFVQQGDELGAADTILEWAVSSNSCWPSPSLASSAPFPWDDSRAGGFSSGEPWLPPAPNYRYANAKAEFSNDLSHVGVLRVAAAMRKSPAIGPYADITRLGEALAILRWGGTGSLLVVSNVGTQPTEAQLSRIPGLPAEMSVATSSAGSSLSSGAHVNTEKALKLAPGETVLLAGPPRHCGGPGPVDRIATKLTEGWQKLNKYFGNM